MAETTALPTSEQLDARIKACEEELRELKRLRRMVRAVELANAARQRRQEVAHASR